MFITANNYSGYVEIRLYEEDVREHLDKPCLLLSDDFAAAAEELLRQIQERKDERAEEARLAALAAESCPVKVGMEVMDPSAWRNKGIWWRVGRITGEPGHPILHCSQVRADGSAGKRKEKFYNIQLLKVRESTEGKPEPKQPPLKEVAQKISVALRSIPQDRLPERWDNYRQATAAGSRVHIKYSWRHVDRVTRGLALEYLAALESGWVGRVDQLGNRGGGE